MSTSILAGPWGEMSSAYSSVAARDSTGVVIYSIPERRPSSDPAKYRFATPRSLETMRRIYINIMISNL